MKTIHTKHAPAAIGPYSQAKQAAAYAAHAREVKAKGGKWCDCPACAPGREILDRKEELC